MQTKNIINKSGYQSHPTWERLLGIIGKYGNEKTKPNNNKHLTPPTVNEEL